jgi:hypothetical protein
MMVHGALNREALEENHLAATNRWGIAAAGIVMQMALGAVYAWSVFKKPLMKQYHWSSPDVTLNFTICVSLVDIAAFFGGLWLNRKGPRIVALTGGFLYGLGIFLASFSATSFGGFISATASLAASAWDSDTSFPLPYWSSGFPTDAASLPALPSAALEPFRPLPRTTSAPGT